ncbi:rod shape determining protein RodA [Lachnospiraceae bacterium KH1T2]|nr:rod shape determining protein RodA [Lachnospiraceae bacterium KH1T2]
MPRKYHLRNFDFLLVIFSTIISIYGIFIIGSARTSFQPRQMIGLGIGLVVMFGIALIDYQTILNFYWIFYILNIILLMSVKLFGIKVNNATRWVSIAGIQFQPSETAKFLLILFFAKLIMKYRDKINRPIVLFILSVLFLIPWHLVQSEPDLSTSIVLLLIFASLIFIGGLSWKIVLGFFSVAIPVTVIGLMLALQPNQQIIKGYQQTRILAWLNPEKYSNQEGYQQQNSIIAIGSGQLVGKGYKNNEVASVKNANFISEPQTDFIFAIVGEELGFVGSMAVIILIFFIVVRIILIGLTADELSGTLLCAGVAAHIGFQTFMNIAVTTGLMPNTGLPLPFVSYGMTSLISLFMEIGVVLNVGLQRIRDNYGRY